MYLPRSYIGGLLIPGLEIKVYNNLVVLGDLGGLSLPAESIAN